MIFYLFTKTNWDEPPRIRHQLAKLLIKNNYDVYFFQKPKQDFSTKIKTESLDEITLIRYSELIHHQLRPCTYVQIVNGSFCKKNIRKATKYLPLPNVIINFNYDYYFLRDIFSNIPIITLLNDDFVGLAKPWMKKESNRVLLKTIEMSDKTITVSNYIKDYLYPGKNISLFLPWSETGYHGPLEKKERKTVLYFGYIDSKRIDVPLFEKIVNCSDYNFIIIGFLERKPSKILKSIFNNKRVTFLGPMDIESINFEEIFCSIVPYNILQAHAKSITLNNRTFQLLSKGIPIVILKLPYLLNIDREIVWQADTINSFVDGIKYFQRNFYKLQRSIEKFVNANNLVARTEELMRFIEQAKANRQVI